LPVDKALLPMHHKVDLYIENSSISLHDDSETLLSIMNGCSKNIDTMILYRMNLEPL
jgi:hypothetical protein